MLELLRAVKVLCWDGRQGSAYPSGALSIHTQALRVWVQELSTPDFPHPTTSLPLPA